MKRLSLSTMREWRLETLPLGSTTSLPGTRPMVTSASVNVTRRSAPSFSAMTTVNMPAASYTPPALAHSKGGLGDDPEPPPLEVGPELHHLADHLERPPV